ncbi:hypothetical protein Sste5346_000089 [Sporothrix stenoceras]|uniref:Protein phosphatase 4 core regulatory subunit R2 n=1 Tax=Sporothrix stenoceras TaxID=5173 RepID=A0ABR3ZTK4_9PEZI
MDVDSDEELLHRLAAGGTIDYDLWPRLLQTVISRLQTIVDSEYPVPVIPPPRRTQSKLPQPTWPAPIDSDASNGVGIEAPASDPAQGSESESRQDVDKENNDPSSAAGPSGAAGEGGSNDAPGADDSTAVAAQSVSPKEKAAPDADAGADAPSTEVAAPEAAPQMPQPVLDLVEYIIATLKTTFHTYPPHSIQRLAELIIAPRQHYRYLASYLHAVDRVVSVTSGLNAFPLPPAEPEAEAMAALQSVVIPSAPGDPDSDEDMGDSGLSLAANPASDDPLGALLTPIPWLRRRPSSGAGDTTDDDGSSPPSSTDGSEIAFSVTSSTAGSVHGANASRAPTSLLQQQQQQSQSSASSSQQLLQQQQQQQQGGPPQHRMEVRTEATETIEGPNGMGGVETVSVSINGIPSHGAAMVAAVQRQQQRGITQGELLRQEQTAGVVPVSQLARVAAARAAAVNGMAGFGDRFRPGGHDDEDDEEEDDEENEMDEDEDDDMERHAHNGQPATTTAAADNNPDAEPEGPEDTDMSGTGSEKEDKEKGEEGKGEDDEEIPHARGPQEIGAADMGPQRPSSRAAGAVGGSDGGSSGGLLIGSAADASQVDMRDIDVEAAVGRKASALPPGTVAAPVVPFSSRESVRENASEDETASSTAPTTTSPPARSTTPKREAENELESDGPAAKKRKEDHDESEVKADTSIAPEATKEHTAEPKGSEDKSEDATVETLSKKDDEASGAA